VVIFTGQQCILYLLRPCYVFILLQEALAIVMDVGPGMCHGADGESSFFEQSRAAIDMILQRKVCYSAWGYWHQRADERIGDLPPRCIQDPVRVNDKNEKPQQNVLVVLHFCVSRGNVVGMSSWAE